SGFAAEAFEWPAPLVCDQNGHFFGSEEPAGYVLEKTKAARFAMVGSIVFLQAQRSAIRALHVKCRIGPSDIASEVLCLLDDLTSEIFDLLHEIRPFQAALFHELKLILPFSGKFGGRQNVNPDSAKRRDQRNALCCGNQFLPIAGDILVV